MIHGLLFRIAAMTFGDYKRRVQNYKYHTEADFLSTYNEHMAAMDIVAESAKIYIIENWEKVKDWSGLDIKIYDNTKKITEYYNYKPTMQRTKSKVIQDMWDEFDADNAKKHNPIVSFDNAILDHTDGDFSVKINGNDHFWISNDNIILIADYIEKNQ